MNSEIDADILIRPAGPEDMDAVLSLVLELAEYENLSDRVTATADILRESLFGPEPAAKAVILEYRGRLAGYAVYFRTFSTFHGRPGLYVEDVYVRPEFRRKGLARAVFVFLARLALERGYARLELAVLEWNEPALRLYGGLGGRRLNDWLLYRFSGEGLLRLAGKKAGPQG